MMGGGSKNTEENQTTGMIVITDNFPLSSFILSATRKLTNKKKIAMYFLNLFVLIEDSLKN
jgi:hypothetical protein